MGRKKSLKRPAEEMEATEGTRPNLMPKVQLVIPGLPLVSHLTSEQNRKNSTANERMRILSLITISNSMSSVTHAYIIIFIVLLL